MRTTAIRTVTTVVIGAGHAGLAMSRCLSDRSIDHVVLERGEVAHTWRTERWDALRLLTPNWQSRLPSFSYNGNDPNGYRTFAEVIEFIASYAKAVSAPVLTHTTVASVRCTEAGYLVRTDQGDWLCRAVEIASGACNIADIPIFANKVPRSIMQLTARSSVIRKSSPMVASWSSVHPRAVLKSPMKYTARAARSLCPWVSTSERHAFTVAKTWSGGWMPPACWTSATTRWTILFKGATGSLGLSTCGHAGSIEPRRHQRSHRNRGEACWASRRYRRKRKSAVFRIIAQRVCPFQPARWEGCSTRWTSGRIRTASTPQPADHIACHLPALRRRRHSAWT